MRQIPKVSKFWIFLIGLLFVRGVYANHYFIPSESMLPNLKIGDHVLTFKRAYTDEAPARGDVVVFEYPRNRDQLFVKRLIAVPGDHVEIRDGRLTINGIAATYRELSRSAGSVKFEECWQNNCRTIQRQTGLGLPDFDFVVLPGHFFMMGDNRDNSSDSRVWGLLPRDHIVGRGTRVLWNLTLNAGLPSGDLSRVGLKL